MYIVMDSDSVGMSAMGETIEEAIREYQRYHDMYLSITGLVVFKGELIDVEICEKVKSTKE